MSRRLALSREQRALLARAVVLGGEWFRARSGGERVTLASLYRKGLLERRAWRGRGADAAHEYRASALVLEVWREVKGSS